VSTRLLSTRFGALVIAIALAAAAALVVLVYVHSYKSNIQSQGAQVKILVATQTVPQFTPGNQIVDGKMYRIDTVSAGSLVDGAISDPAQLKGLVARSDIFPGAQLTTNQFQRSDTTSAAVKLQADQRGMAFPVDNSTGMIGQIQAGDHVDALTTCDVLPVGANGLSLPGAVAIPVTKVVASDVLVVTAPNDPNVGGTKLSSQNSNPVLTLAVSAASVAQLAFAQEKCKLIFALRPPGSTSELPTTPTTVGNVLRGDNAAAGPVARLVRSFG
jgi:Flp pilus assembly protein CpaB